VWLWCLNKKITMPSYAAFSMYYNNNNRLDIMSSDTEMEEFCNERIDEYLLSLDNRVGNPFVNEEIMRYQRGTDMSIDKLVSLLITLGRIMVDNQRGWGVVDVIKSPNVMAEMRPVPVLSDPKNQTNLLWSKPPPQPPQLRRMWTCQHNI